METVTQLEDYIESLNAQLALMGIPQSALEEDYKALVRRDLELAEAQLDELLRGEQ